MKKIKIAVIFLLIAVFTCQATACNWSVMFGTPTVDGPHMDERIYERMDEVAIDALLDEIYVLLEADGNCDEVVLKRETLFNDYYMQAFTMNTLASINYDKDVTSEYWQEESVWALNFAQNFQNDVVKLEQAILSSEYYGEFFTDLLGEDYANSILVYETESDEQLQLLAQISELEAQYNMLYVSEEYDAIPSLYVNLVKLRNQYAQTKSDENGNKYANYMDYAYANIYGREYTPDEVSSFRGYVRKHFKDVRDHLLTFASNSAFNADATLRDEAKLLSLLPAIINDSVPEAIKSYNYMVDHGLYDFSYSRKKANTSYVTSFSEYGDAFMFINPTSSVLSDVSTLVHEFGHYNEHFMADPRLEDDNLMSYDLAETHSQAFELITLDSVKKAFAKNFPDNRNLYKSYAWNLLINSVWAVMSNCIFDEFEYTVYNADPADLTEDFVESSFNISWGHYWSSGGYEFYDIPHFFSSPAYCISYSVSLVFSAEIWASENPVKNYVKAVKYGTGNTLSNVYTALNLDNPLSEEVIIDVADKILMYSYDNLK